MQLIYARYNKYHNSIDITTYNGCLPRIDCNKVEHGLKVTLNSQCSLIKFKLWWIILVGIVIMKQI